MTSAPVERGIGRVGRNSVPRSRRLPVLEPPLAHPARVGVEQFNQAAGIEALHVPPSPNDSNANTVANAIAGFDFPIWYGLWAPAGTPMPV